MSNGDTGSQIPVERIDADAVCARCGTVNPEDTLLCKTCGNNLRDQRARRVAEGAEAVLAPPRRAWLGKSLVAACILILIWTALNFTRIEEWMVEVGTSDAAHVEAYWSGRQGREYDEMLQQLKDNPITPDEVEKARQQPVADGRLEGRYALMENDFGRRLIGEAVVRQDDDRILFVARLRRGDAELRGEAALEGAERVAVRESGAVSINGRHFGVSGFAQQTEGGGFQCFGMSDFGNDYYSAFAYRIP